MCKERLAKDADSRKAVDPCSNKEVDKAKAVIGADAEGNVQYFENEENLEGVQRHRRAERATTPPASAPLWPRRSAAP